MADKTQIGSTPFKYDSYPSTITIHHTTMKPTSLEAILTLYQNTGRETTVEVTTKISSVKSSKISSTKSKPILKTTFTTNQGTELTTNERLTTEHSPILQSTGNVDRTASASSQGSTRKIISTIYATPMADKRQIGSTPFKVESYISTTTIHNTTMKPTSLEAIHTLYQITGGDTTVEVTNDISSVKTRKISSTKTMQILDTTLNTNLDTKFTTDEISTAEQTPVPQSTGNVTIVNNPTTTSTDVSPTIFTKTITNTITTLTTSTTRTTSTVSSANC